MSCKECVKRGKTWEGSNPKCAFGEKVFTSNNWNCATMNLLRDKVEEFFTYRNDMRSASIGIINIPESEKEDIQQGYLIMTWYKERGQTGQAYIMWDENEPQILTLKTAEFILKRINEIPSQI